MEKPEAATTDKTALLGDLKIDREAPVEKGKPTAMLVGVAILFAVAVGAWYFYSPPSQANPIPVSSVIAHGGEAISGNSVLDATGYVVARRQATVSSKATGKVVKVLIEEGVVVSEGQLLATLDDSIPEARFELAKSQHNSSKAALAEIEVALKQAKLDLDRTRGLAEKKLASDADLDRDSLSVEALVARLNRAQKDILVSERSMAVQKQQLDDMQIRAPFAGVVIAKAAQPGEMISPVSAGGGFTRTGICTIVDMDSLEVEVDVNESYINRVAGDQAVEVALNAYPDDKFSARVIAIIPAADRNKATVRVRIAFLEKDARVLPDMGVRVAFLADEEPADEAPLGVSVPIDAIFEEDGRKMIYVINGQVAQKRAVRTGEKQGANIRVLTGVKNGQRVVAGLDEQLAAQLFDGVQVQVRN